VRSYLLAILAAGSLPAVQDRPAFKAKTTLVTVPVVVRDRGGRAVGNLPQGAFRLFDNGKLQTVKQFSVEKLGERAQGAAVAAPERFVALVFDDAHLQLGGMNAVDHGFLVLAREAAQRLAGTLDPGDRVAVFTTTGRIALDFTGHRGQLEEALLKLRTTSPSPAPNWDTRASLRVLQAVVRRMSLLPGKRILALISPGFVVYSEHDNLLPDAMDVIENAFRARVVINSLNVRGLDAAGRGPDDILALLSDGTGGTYPGPTNDYDAAFRRAAAAPEYVYVLGFSPNDLKQDGSLHKLKVTLENSRGLDVQSRTSYWDALPGAAPVPEGGQVLVKTAPEPLHEDVAETREMAQALSAAPPPPAPPKDAPEMATRDEAVTFKAKVNLVMVPVVVRDRDGHAVGGLHKENFDLLDRGKRQTISRFTVEKGTGQLAAAGREEKPPAAAPVPAEGAAAAVQAPVNFVAYLFDDIHLKFDDIPQVRDAVIRHVTTALGPADRTAIYTTSGRTSLDFTDDRAKLRATLLALRPNPLSRSMVRDCPDISYYMADRIEKEGENDAMPALALMIQETMACAKLDPRQYDQAREMTLMASRRVLAAGEHETRAALAAVKALVRRVSAMPGRRSIILVSPGFVVTDSLLFDESEAIDRALQLRVIIGALDARGLWTPAEYDASLGGRVDRRLAQYMRMEQTMNNMVLGVLAEGTGGTFIHDSNDFDAGIRALAAPPEYVYMLGFAPPDLKPDGKFHALSVKLNVPGKFTVQARRGYFAPRHTASPEGEAKQEIENAVFSREEIHELPLDVQTQFFKSAEAEVKLSVLAKVDLKQVQFRKEGERNRNDLTLVSALFDRNGLFVSAIRKVIEMRLRDETVAKLQTRPPLTIRTEFTVKPGTYALRLVLRDTEGQLMSTENATVEIP
jgi:VWFA-related protein